MRHVSRLGLGTVQFGAAYGISNCDGRPTEREIAAILACACETGMGYLDTAASYAHAEALIGRHLPAAHRMRIITKLPPVEDDAIGPRHAEATLNVIANSLERLRTAQVHGLLIHQARDLTKSGWEYLIDALQQARSQGMTEYIGVSVYDEDDLALVLRRFTPDIVQLPINVLDRRLARSGWLLRLRAAGIKVHARSVFLQGLLLMDPATVPDFFIPLRATLANLHAAWATEGLTPLEACLRCILHTAEIDAVIVGINRLKELDDIRSVVARISNEIGELEFVDEIDPIFLDPRRWPRKH